MKKVLALALIACLSLFVGTMAAPVIESALYVDVSPLAIAAPLFTLSSINYFYYEMHPDATHGKLFMAVSVELWAKLIQDNIFKQNPHLLHAFKADDYVLQGSVVHIPQAGAKPTVVKNRSSFPATAVRRTDTDITYALDTYTTDPTHIYRAEETEISYDKMMSVFGEHLNVLNEVIGDAMIYKWRAEAAANILRTTGGAVLSHLPSATGNRNIFLKEDLKRAATRMNILNIPKNDRYALLDPEMFGQLMDDADLKKRDVGMELDMKNGVIFRLYGFNLLERSTAGIYTNAGTPVAKDYDAAGAATDNAAVLCWQKDAVESATGTIEVFENQKDPLYYGDIISGLVKFGGRKRRTNGEGVVAIVQAANP